MGLSYYAPINNQMSNDRKATLETYQRFRDAVEIYVMIVRFFTIK